MQTTIPYTIVFVPETTAEASATVAAKNSSIDKNARLAEAGGGWTWQIALPPSVPCKINFQAEGSPDFQITTENGNSIAHRMRHENSQYTVEFITPQDLPLGGRIYFTFRAVHNPIQVRYFNLVAYLPDANDDGISDWIASLLGKEPLDKITLIPRPTEPHTSYFYAWRYDPAMAVPTDAIRLYFWGTKDDPVMFPNWAAKGYQAQTMLHSRFSGGLEVTADQPDVQHDRQGRAMGVHFAQKDDKTLDLIVPMVTDKWKADVAQRFGVDFEVKCADYYRVPNKERDLYANRHYAGALDAGATGFGYDEPEFWTYSGYSETFKQEWLSYYGTPWIPPHSSIEARYMADQLKGYLFTRQTQTILQDVEQHSRTPSVDVHISFHLIHRLADANHSGLVKNYIGSLNGPAQSLSK